MAPTRSFVDLWQLYRQKSLNAILEINWRSTYVIDCLCLSAILRLRRITVQVRLYICWGSDNLWPIGWRLRSRSQTFCCLVSFVGEPYRRKQKPPAKKILDRKSNVLNPCISWSEFCRPSTYWFWNAIWYSCGKTGLIRKACRHSKSNAMSTDDKVAEE